MNNLDPRNRMVINIVKRLANCGRHVCLLLATMSTLLAYTQLRYPVVGTYKGKSAQGMAIWKNNAYIFNDGGHCRVLDLKTGWRIL